MMKATWKRPDFKGNNTVIESFFGPYVSCSTIPFHKNDAYQKRFIKNNQNMIYTYYIWDYVVTLANISQ